MFQLRVLVISIYCLGNCVNKQPQHNKHGLCLHRQSVSVTDTLCLSQIVCVYLSQSFYFSSWLFLAVRFRFFSPQQCSLCTRSALIYIAESSPDHHWEILHRAVTLGHWPCCFFPSIWYLPHSVCHYVVRSNKQLCD